MYFTTKTNCACKISIIGVARIKGDAWNQMRSAVFEELENRNALGSFRHVAEARLGQVPYRGLACWMRKSRTLSTRSLLKVSKGVSPGLIRSMKALRKSWITVVVRAGLIERGPEHDHKRI